jgi:hypothetical protein
MFAMQGRRKTGTTSLNKTNTLPVATFLFKDEMNPHFRDVLYGETKN